MELQSTIAFIGETETLERIDDLINEESILDSVLYSTDFVSELETSDTYVYRCVIADGTWVNIYEIQETLKEHLGASTNVDVIYTSTDAKTYVDVISCSGLFDAYVDSDLDKIEEVCENYGLEFYGNCSADDVEYYDEDEDEENYF